MVIQSIDESGQAMNRAFLEHTQQGARQFSEIAQFHTARVQSLGDDFVRRFSGPNARPPVNRSSNTASLRASSSGASSAANRTQAGTQIGFQVSADIVDKFGRTLCGCFNYLLITIFILVLLDINRHSMQEQPPPPAPPPTIMNAMESKLPSNKITSVLQLLPTMK